MSENIRVRFAPSPTGNVHIGNIRVAIFNWLFARRHGGKFLLRIEDTDLERSTPEAIQTLLEAMRWLGLDYDEEVVYQTSQRPKHDYAAETMQNLGNAYLNSDADPAVVFAVNKQLFDPSFVTEPGAEAALDLSGGGALRGTLRSLVIIDRNPKTGEEYFRPVPWDTIEAGLSFDLEGGGSISGETLLEAVRAKCGSNLSAETSCDLHEAAGGKIKRAVFKRRIVFFDDLVLGRMEKPLDSLRDFVIVRGDGSPVFHLGNVVDDVSQGITHILRGNDHVENTFRHLFLFKAVNAAPPRYGHFPMIVNAQGKPYSKRDGDAYIGDFRAKGFLPEALFNFLALCGWAPGDDREKMARMEMAASFDLARVNASPAQFNIEKLEWLNGRYLAEMEPSALLPLLKDEIATAGLDASGKDEAWLLHLVGLQRERIRTLRDFIGNTRYFFAASVSWDEKAVAKVFKKPVAGELLSAARPVLAALAESEWNPAAIEAALNQLAESKGAKMGDIGQPLRVAVTGGTVSPPINETLYLLGKAGSLARIDAFLSRPPVAAAN